MQWMNEVYTFYSLKCQNCYTLMLTGLDFVVVVCLFSGKWKDLSQQTYDDECTKLRFCYASIKVFKYINVFALENLKRATVFACCIYFVTSPEMPPVFSAGKARCIYIYILQRKTCSPLSILNLTLYVTDLLKFVFLKWECLFLINTLNPLKIWNGIFLWKNNIFCLQLQITFLIFFFLTVVLAKWL